MGNCRLPGCPRPWGWTRPTKVRMFNWISAPSQTRTPISPGHPPEWPEGAHPDFLCPRARPKRTSCPPTSKPAPPETPNLPAGSQEKQAQWGDRQLGLSMELGFRTRFTTRAPSPSRKLDSWRGLVKSCGPGQELDVLGAVFLTVLLAGPSPILHVCQAHSGAHKQTQLIPKRQALKADPRVCLCVASSPRASSPGALGGPSPRSCYPGGTPELP